MRIGDFYVTKVSHIFDKKMFSFSFRKSTYFDVPIIVSCEQLH